MDFESLLNIEKLAIDLALTSGQMMRSSTALSTSLVIDEKRDFADLVTNVDREVEAFVFGEIRKKYPSHKLIGEESVSSKFEYTNDPTWIIDPIDVNKQLLIGVIYNPFSEKLYTAKKGCGAYCNGVPIKVRNCQSIKNALLLGALSGPPERALKYAENAKSLSWISHGFRDIGSAALSICYVASGYCDACYHFGLHCWDMAAGVVILTEAGGCVLDTDGGPFDLMSGRFLIACNLTIAEAVKNNIRHQMSNERECTEN